MQLLNISTEWANEDRSIIIIRYEKGWTWQDFETTDAATRTMLDIVDHKVSFILDARKAVIPKGFSFHFPDIIKNTSGLTHTNSEYNVIVGMKPYLRALYRIFNSLYKEDSQTTFMVTSLEKAYELIAEQRGTTVKEGVKDSA